MKHAEQQPKWDTCSQEELGSLNPPNESRRAIDGRRLRKSMSRTPLPSPAPAPQKYSTHGMIRQIQNAIIHLSQYHHLQSKQTALIQSLPVLCPHLSALSMRDILALILMFEWISDLLLVVKGIKVEFRPIRSRSVYTLSNPKNLTHRDEFGGICWWHGISGSARSQRRRRKVASKDGRTDGRKEDSKALFCLCMRAARRMRHARFVCMLVRVHSPQFIWLYPEILHARDSAPPFPSNSVYIYVEKISERIICEWSFQRFLHFEKFKLFKI